MKKVLSVFAVAGTIFMAACGNNPTAIQNDKGVTYADTVGLAQYKAWQAQQMAAMTAAATAPAVATAPVTKTSTAKKSSAAKRASSSTQSKSLGTTTSYPAKPAEKKGWSKAAKGTAIGAAGGAVIGAVVNKRNRAVGAVIGGVAGGAVGYGIGRSMDKKDGRY